ncbi:hypothetical protein VPNG_02186 [Cytospora leucostoma]|uniref:Uncharacterized protein n=1 Tax=Cytospora leucostoma TaxID=1230097 RepID=A0A423XHS2_9PEZI|nr:hypothetical protein VPNG_02186 [Cytospora leucostoma]
MAISGFYESRGAYSNGPNDELRPGLLHWTATQKWSASAALHVGSFAVITADAGDGVTNWQYLNINPASVDGIEMAALFMLRPDTNVEEQ